MRDLVPGTRVGEWVIQAVAGRGGMGRVYRAHSPRHHVAALKLMDVGSDDGTFRQRFAHEVEAALRVSGKHIAAVLDADANAETPWLATEYIDGPTLGEAVRTSGPFSADDTLTLVADVAQALVDIHAAGIVHRDLKPSNVLIGNDGRVCVIDFGIAAWDGATHLTRTGHRAGTAEYLSPEQVAGRPAAAASDVFALGAVAYFASCGRSPFASHTYNETLARVAGGTYDIGPISDGRVATVIAACLAPIPAARPSPAELITMCRQVLASPPHRISRGSDAEDVPQDPTIIRARSMPDTGPGTSPRRTRRRTLVLGVVVSIACLGVVGGGYALWPRRPGPTGPPALSATLGTFPRGNVVTLTWEAPPTGPELRTTLQVGGAAPPPGCPSVLTTAGTCTFTGDYDTRYAVVVRTEANGQLSRIGPETTVTTYPQPSLAVGPGKIVTDESTGQKGCTILVTASGLAPDTTYDASLMTRYWETRKESPKPAKTTAKTDARGSLRGVTLAEATDAGPREWGYAQPDGWVRVTLATLTATQRSLGVPVES